MNKMMCLIVAGFGFMATAESLNCSVGELSSIPLNVQLEKPIDICRQIGTDTRVCAQTQVLTYDDLAIEANQLLGGCGLKSSELKLEDGHLSGKVFSCRFGYNMGSANLDHVNCESRKSADGTLDLTMCSPLGTDQIITFVFDSHDSAHSEGSVLLSNPGNDVVVTINALSCGEQRQHFHLKTDHDKGKPGLDI